MDEQPKKRILIDPDFLKLPVKGSKTRKNKDEHKPIKIRGDPDNKTIRKNTLNKMRNQIRKQQEDRYKKLLKGEDVASSAADPKLTCADEFKSDFDDSLQFLQKLTDQNAEKLKQTNLSSTLKNHSTTTASPPPLQSILFQDPGLPLPSFNPPDYSSSMRNGANPVLASVAETAINLVEPVGIHTIAAKQPLYGCLKGGKLPTYRTYKNNVGGNGGNGGNGAFFGGTAPFRNSAAASTSTSTPPPSLRLTPEQQRAELKQFIDKRKQEKQRVENVKKQRNLLKPKKMQKRKTTRTFRVGKSKHYPRVGVLIPNKTMRAQILAKKQKIRETPVEDMRKHLIKTGLIRVGSSCPNDVLRKMYESSMMMCGELQNHNPDNLLYNYLHNGI